MLKPLAYFTGTGNIDTLNLHLPDNVYKPHLVPSGAPTALVTVSGDSVSAKVIESQMARVCPGHAHWKWEAILHGVNTFTIAVPSADDLHRIDGIQLGVPSSKAQITITTWKFQDIPPMVVLQPFWVQVEGVPHAVRHFHGLWAVGWLVGAPQDVDLVTLRSRGIVRIQIAMLDTSVFDTNSDASGNYARAVVMIRLNGYEFRFRREAPDFIPDPKFKPFFWKRKDDDVDGDTGNDGTGKDPESDVRRASTTATSMDVDSTQSYGCSS
jgi:hypothetical protein